MQHQLAKEEGAHRYHPPLSYRRCHTGQWEGQSHQKHWAAGAAALSSSDSSSNKSSKLGLSESSAATGSSGGLAAAAARRARLWEPVNHYKDHSARRSTCNLRAEAPPNQTQTEPKLEGSAILLDKCLVQLCKAQAALHRNRNRAKHQRTSSTWQAS
jgi:hypothetical protein